MALKFPMFLPNIVEYTTFSAVRGTFYKNNEGVIKEINKKIKIPQIQWKVKTQHNKVSGA